MITCIESQVSSLAGEEREILQVIVRGYLYWAIGRPSVCTFSKFKKCLFWDITEDVCSNSSLSTWIYWKQIGNGIVFLNHHSPFCEWLERKRGVVLEPSLWIKAIECSINKYVVEIGAAQLPYFLVDLDQVGALVIEYNIELSLVWFPTYNPAIILGSN